MSSDWVVREGFQCAHGRFITTVGHVERIDSSRLQRLFVPRMTPEGNKLLRDKHDFVRAQLLHYGVEYDKKSYSGKGTMLLKKVLEAGKVPDHIEALRLQMHSEWLETQSPEQLAGHPEFAMEKYFVDHEGVPDSTKTTRVIGFPLPPFSTYRAGQLREAASTVPGLHQATANGPSTQTMYIGWDRKAVDAAANRHAREEAAQREEQAEQEAERAAEHKKYLADMKKKTTKGHMSPSPIGRYTIDCQAIENNWPGEAENMTLSIQPTQTSGVFQVHFDFGILKGMMMISSDESALAPFSADNEDDEDDDDSEGDTNDDPHERPATGSKRKATTTKGRGPSKTTKKDAGRKSTKYFLRMKSRETGEGQINPVAENGTITLKGSDFASFTGQADEMNCVGQGVVFTGRKVSDVPRKSHEQWKDYSWAAYEHARISRW